MCISSPQKNEEKVGNLKNTEETSSNYHPGNTFRYFAKSLLYIYVQYLIHHHTLLQSNLACWKIPHLLR